MNEKCQTKMSFDTKKAAENAARVAAHQHGSKLKSYKCRTCKLWHLASRYN
ncbi:hypothetical protein KC992_03195 [Candidatus Saccharibacteria bacterium]|nr:hypothetical protein [Candidatus Saccharibacteria bacterium]